MAVAAIGGTALEAGGQIYAGNAAGAAADYNAQVARQKAEQTRQAAAEEERRARIQGRKAIGRQRAAFGASGIALGGSALDVLSETASNAELDALTIRHGGAVKAQGFENEATLDEFKGSVARTQGYLGASATILKSVGSAASSAGAGGG